METPKSTIDFTKFNKTKTLPEKVKTWEILEVSDPEFGPDVQLMKLPSGHWWLMDSENVCLELGKYVNPRPLYLSPEEFDLKSWMKIKGDFLWSPTIEQRKSIHAQLIALKRSYHEDDEMKEAIFIDGQCIAWNHMIDEWGDLSREKGRFERYLTQILDKDYVLSVGEEFFYPVPRSALTERIIIDHKDPYRLSNMVKELPAELKA